MPQKMQLVQQKQGDYPQLSKQDLSIIALGIELSGDNQ